MKKIIARFISVSSLSLITLHQANGNPLVVNVQDFLKMEDNIRFLTEVVDGLTKVPRVPPGTVVAFAGEKDKVPTGWVLCDGSSLSRDEYRMLFNVIGTAHGTGENDNSTFNVPDYRGYFLRGVSYDTSMNRDLSAEHRIAMNQGGNSGNKVGSIQLDSFKEHHHGSGNLRNSSSSVHISGTAYPDQRGHKLTTSRNGDHSHSYTAPGSYRDAGWATGSPRFFQSPSSSSSSTSGEHSHSVTINLPNYTFSTYSSISPQIISGATSNNGDNETRPKNAYVNYIIKT
jgi:microcystin-dependent protein